MEINDEILKDVASKSMLNAQSLMSDADILREAKRYQRAYALYQFAMEEVGKALSSVMLLVLIDRNEEDIKEYKKGFFRHPHKIKKSRLLDMFICQFLHKGDYEKAIEFLESSISENENDLDEQKNKSLYTAVINNTVMMPSEMIGEEKMNYIWYRVLGRYGMAQAFVNILLKHYGEIRQYQQENQSIKNMMVDVEKAVKEFWDEIHTADEAS
jgi:AbiV family abortive infection protein